MSDGIHDCGAVLKRNDFLKVSERERREHPVRMSDIERAVDKVVPEMYLPPISVPGVTKAELTDVVTVIASLYTMLALSKDKWCLPPDAHASLTRLVHEYAPSREKFVEEH
jgi:hypothetical protein